jgi:hypothetical protein
MLLLHLLKFFAKLSAASLHPKILVLVGTGANHIFFLMGLVASPDALFL